jgi:hypothetical protein
MKTSIILQTLFIFPLIGLALVARSAWVKVLAFVAGLGMSSACNADGAKPRADNGDPDSMVECYKQVAVTPAIMQDPRWAHSDLVADWAMAERAVLAYAETGEDNYDELEKRITTARQAATNARPIVTAGMLSQKEYDLAISILGEWHADMAMGTGGVKCYKRMAPPPVVTDSIHRLSMLLSLKEQNKLTGEAVAQAKEEMKSTLTKSLSKAESARLSDFLIDLLGITQ